MPDPYQGLGNLPDDTLDAFRRGLGTLSDAALADAVAWFSTRTEEYDTSEWWGFVCSGVALVLLSERILRTRRTAEVNNALARAYLVDDVDPDDVGAPPLPTRSGVVTLQPDDTWTLSAGTDSGDGVA